MVTIKGLDSMPRYCAQCRFCEVQRAYDLGERGLRLFCNAELWRLDAVNAMQEREEFCPLKERYYIWKDEKDIVKIEIKTNDVKKMDEVVKEKLIEMMKENPEKAFWIELHKIEGCN